MVSLQHCSMSLRLRKKDLSLWLSIIQGIGNSYSLSIIYLPIYNINHITVSPNQLDASLMLVMSSVLLMALLNITLIKWLREETWCVASSILGARMGDHLQRPVN